MGRIKLAGLLPGVGGKIADEIFVDETENIIILLAVHRNILDKINQIADGLCPCARGLPQFRKPGLERGKNIVEHFLVGRVDKPAESRQCVCDIFGGKVNPLGNPTGEKIVVGDKVSKVFPNALYRLAVLLGKLRKVLICPVIFPQIPDLFIRKKLIKNEAEYVVLIFVRLNFRAHPVSGFPNLRCKLLFVHLAAPLIL